MFYLEDGQRWILENRAKRSADDVMLFTSSIGAVASACGWISNA